MTATAFVRELSRHITEPEQAKLRRLYRGDDPHTKALGVRFGIVFDTAKRYAAMPVAEIEKLLESDYYEVRMGAVSIMDHDVRRKRRHRNAGASCTSSTSAATIASIIGISSIAPPRTSSGAIYGTRRAIRSIAWRGRPTRGNGVPRSWQPTTSSSTVR